ncbi:MAG: hypothetical protein JXR39_01795 [Marinilabiliaceae bacterium]|nr:hypothetical protein [Marinilabiliaceae bacterium]
MRSNSLNKSQLNFRQWSRKGYAVFASLGRLVRIAVLKLTVSETLACKERKGAVVLQPQATVGDASDEPEVMTTGVETLVNAVAVWMMLSVVPVADKVAGDSILLLFERYSDVALLDFFRQGFFFSPTRHLRWGGERNELDEWYLLRLEDV